MTFTFLCGTSLTKGGVPEVRHADSLYRAGFYLEAAIAYERMYFGEADAEGRTLARLGRARCFKQTGEYARALRELNEVSLYGLADSLQYQVRYETALQQFLIKDHEAARSTLRQMRFYSGSTFLTGETEVMDILNDHARYDYPAAREKAHAWVLVKYPVGSLQDSILQQIDYLYSKKNLPRVVRANKAVWFSRIIPGTGQAYAGFTGEGAVSFLLNLLALGTGTYGIVQGYYLTGYIVGTGMLQKLYFGSLRRTVLLTDQGNAHRARKFQQEAASLLFAIESLRP